MSCAPITDKPCVPFLAAVLPSAARPRLLQVTSKLFALAVADMPASVKLPIAKPRMLVRATSTFRPALAVPAFVPSNIIIRARLASKQLALGWVAPSTAVLLSLIVGNAELGLMLKGPVPGIMKMEVSTPLLKPV